ncbi:MAG: arginase [Herpetosiphon sp.]
MYVDIIGVPLDFGAGRRGVDMGPSAIRYAGLREGLEALDHTVDDLGNLPVPLAETCAIGDAALKYLDPIVAVAGTLALVVGTSLAQGHVPLVLGGDHSLALGSIAGAASHCRPGVIWFDAHGDFNTAETSPSGNIHGMPLAALCGYGDARLQTLGGHAMSGAKLNPRNVVLVGIRDLDRQERRLLEEAQVTVFSMEAIDRYGIFAVMERALAIASDGTDGLWLSLDLDGIDPTFAPGVGTAVTGGISLREAYLAAEQIAETKRLIGMDLVEVNPILDTGNRTAMLAVKLALSAFGQRIWNATGGLEAA